MRFLTPLLMLPILLVGGQIAQAAAPQFDDGTSLNLDNVYANTQSVSDIFTTKGVYGKLTDSADIYKIVPEQDGDQLISLLGKASSTAQPFLVLVDPTDLTPARSLGIPLPDETYHSAVIQAVDGARTSYETFSFDAYTVFAEQKVTFKKGMTYYLIVFDPSVQLKQYVIRFGEGKIWTFGNIFRHIGGWFKVKTQNYGGSSPFHFTPTTFGGLLFFLAFAVLLGMWVIEESFSFLANRSKMAGYLLIKLQKFSRVFVWIALWFMLLGGYIYFDHIGWPGIPFVLGLLFIPLVAVFLVRTLVISPKLMKLEVSKQEAVIPLQLRRTLYLMFVLSVLSVGSFLVFLTMQFA
jgi:hypothetical protein